MTWVAAVFFAGAADRIYLTFGIPYGAQIWFWRAVALGGPFLVFFVVRRLPDRHARGRAGGRRRRRDSRRRSTRASRRRSRATSPSPRAPGCGHGEEPPRDAAEERARDRPVAARADDDQVGVAELGDVEDLRRRVPLDDLGRRRHAGGLCDLERGERGRACRLLVGVSPRRARRTARRRRSRLRTRRRAPSWRRRQPRVSVASRTASVAAGEPSTPTTISLHATELPSSLWHVTLRRRAAGDHRGKPVVPFGAGTDGGGVRGARLLAFRPAVSRTRGRGHNRRRATPAAGRPPGRPATDAKGWVER